MQNVTKLYRCELTHFNGAQSVYIAEYEVLKETPKGYWIEIGYTMKKWVSKEAKNKWVHYTEYEAYKHFVRRKIYRNKCIEDELTRNEIAISKVKDIIKKLKNDKQRKRNTTKKDN